MLSCARLQDLRNKSLRTTARSLTDAGATSARLESAPSMASAPPRDPGTPNKSTFTGSASSTYEYGGARAGAAARDSASSGMSMRAVPTAGVADLTTDASTLGVTTTAAAAALPAPKDEEEALCRALDDLRARKVPFLGKYLVGGESERRRGGQGVGATPSSVTMCRCCMRRRLMKEWQFCVSHCPLQSARALN